MLALTLLRCAWGNAGGHCSCQNPRPGFFPSANCRLSPNTALAPFRSTFAFKHLAQLLFVFSSLHGAFVF